MRNVSDKICIENRYTIFMFNNFFLKACRSWSNVEKYCRAREAKDDNIIQRMRWLQTHCVWNTCRFSRVTVVMRTRLNVTFILHCLCCLFMCKTFTYYWPFITQFEIILFKSELVFQKYQALFLYSRTTHIPYCQSLPICCERCIF
jgi:hypothetical protein